MYFLQDTYKSQILHYKIYVFYYYIPENSQHTVKPLI